MSYKERRRRSINYGTIRKRTASSFSNKYTKKTKWEVDLLRKDPCFTKTETITPIPEEVSEENKTCLGVGNDAVKVEVSKENMGKMLFPKPTKKKTEAKKTKPKTSGNDKPFA